MPKDESPHHDGQVMVWLKGEVNFERFLAQVNERFPWDFKLNMEVSRYFNIWLLEFDHVKAGGTYEAVVAFRRMPEVGSVQLNHILSLRAAPNDPSYATQQWQYNNTGQGGGTPGADISAEAAWDISTGGRTVLGDTIVVAIIDDGFQRTHPDLSANMWRNWGEIPGNGIDDDGNGYVDDVFGWNAYNSNGTITSSQHGTHVAGIIGARGNNGVGGTGVNWEVKLMPIQGSSNNEATVVAAYAYAATMRDIYNSTNGQQGAFVVATNSSFGVDYGNAANFPIWCAFYDTLGVRGILSAAAGPNLNVNVDVVGDVPTTCASNFLIGVTNTTRTDAQNNGSGFGIQNIDLGAPGTQVWNTVPNNTYSALTGTSMATPHVAGAIALYYSAACSLFIQHYKQNPAALALQMRTYLLNGVDVIPSLTNRVATDGRLNLLKGMQQVLSYNCNPNSPPTAGFSVGSQQGCPGLSVTFSNNSLGTVDSVQWFFPGGQPTSSTQPNPTVTFNQLGTYDVTLIAYNQFGADTLLIPNYISVNNSSVQVLMNETFEAGDLAQLGWTVINPAGNSQWERNAVQGSTPGGFAAGINIFNNQSEAGEFDTLISPPIDASIHSSLVLSFQHAHRRRVTTIRDSMFVLAWSDQQPTPVSLLRLGESGQGTFATAGILNSNFVPQDGSDWCFAGNITNCNSAVNLSAFDGNTNIRLAFVVRNSGGNNIYLDNVRVQGVCSGPLFPPEAAFNSSKQIICAGESVTFSDQSLFSPNSWAWTFMGGTPGTSSLPSPTVNYPSAGSFPIQLVVTNSLGSDQVSSSVQVNPTPSQPQVTLTGNDLVSSTGESYQWLNNGAVIPGATSQTFTPQQNGSYSVRVTNAFGCSATSTPVPFVLSLSEEVDSWVIAFPNPTQGTVYLKGNTSELETVELYDMAGRIVLRQSWVEGGELRLSHLSQGSYLLVLRFRDGQLMRQNVVRG